MSGLMLLGALSGFCTKASPIIQIAGWVLTIFKVTIPLIIIALGLFDLGKAAISSKPEEIKKCATSLVWRLVGAIAIFFIPTIVMLIIGFAGDWKDTKGSVTDYQYCYDCVVSPWKDTCKNAVKSSSSTDVEMNGVQLETNN